MDLRVLFNLGITRSRLWESLWAVSKVARSAQTRASPSEDYPAGNLQWLFTVTLYLWFRFSIWSMIAICTGFAVLKGLIVQRSQFFFQVSITLSQNLDTIFVQYRENTWPVTVLQRELSFSGGDKVILCFSNVCSYHSPISPLHVNIPKRIMRS